MCKAWSDAQKDAERNGEISSAVDTARRYGILEEKIWADIIAQFRLTEEEVRNYLTQKSV